MSTNEGKRRGVMETWWTTLATLATGGGLVAIIRALSDSLKARTIELRATDAQEFTQQERVSNDLRTRIVTLEKARDECLDKHADAQRRMGHLEGRLDELMRSLEFMQKMATSQSRESIKTAGQLAVMGVKAAAQVATESGLKLQLAEATKNVVNTTVTETDLEQVHD